MSRYARISRLEFFFVLTVTAISLAPIGISAGLVREFKQDAWLVVLVGYLAGVLNLFIALRLAGRFPEKNIIEWSPYYLGKWGAWIYGILTISVLFFWSVLMFLEQWHLTTYAQLHRTPQYLPVILEMSAIIYLLTRGLEAWSRAFTAMAPWALIGFLAINIPQFANSDFTRMRPLFHHESSPEQWKQWIFALFLFRSSMLIYYLYPSIKKVNKLMSSSLIAYGIAGMEIILSVVLPVAIFGPNSAGRLTYPYQESLETIHLSGLPLSKISFVSPLMWLIVLVYVLTSSLYCAMKGIKALLPQVKENTIIVLLGIAAMVLLLFPISDMRLNEIKLYWSMFGLLVFMAIPLIFWLIPVKKTR